MIDMIVNLSDKSIFDQEINMLDKVQIIRSNGLTADATIEFIKENFSDYWSSEAKSAVYQQPQNCFIAIYESKIVGFACFHASSRGFFGPTGVLKKMRGKGIGKSLLLTSLKAMRNQGYAYAIIGGVSSAIDFYKKVVNAQIILNSDTMNIYSPFKYDN